MIPSWIDSVIVGILVTIIIYLVYRFFRTRVLFKTLSDLYMQEMADKMLLQKKVEELYQDIENVKLQQTDGFLKFVSESRDWAFQYIEEVQAALSEFDKTVEPKLAWAMKFGMVNGETAHTDILKEISEAYDKLKEVLPKESQTPNN
jgi:nucleoside recognition membrane protein YjiH